MADSGLSEPTWVSSGSYGFLQQSKDMHFSSSGCSKLPTGVCMSASVNSSLCISHLPRV